MGGRRADERKKVDGGVGGGGGTQRKSTGPDILRAGGVTEAVFYAWWARLNGNAQEAGWRGAGGRRRSGQSPERGEGTHAGRRPAAVDRSGVMPALHRAESAQYFIFGERFCVFV